MYTFEIDTIVSWQETASHFGISKITERIQPVVKISCDASQWAQIIIIAMFRKNWMNGNNSPNCLNSQNG